MVGHENIEAVNPRKKKVGFSLLSSSNLPSNDTAKGLVEGLAEVHRAYGVPECVLVSLDFSSARAKFSPRIYSAQVLFVVQPNVAHERALVSS